MGGKPPPPPGHPAYAQPLSPERQVSASMAFATDSNRPQPLWQPPPTAYPTASGAAPEVPSRLMHLSRRGSWQLGGVVREESYTQPLPPQGPPERRRVKNAFRRSMYDLPALSGTRRSFGERGGGIGRLRRESRERCGTGPGWCCACHAGRRHMSQKRGREGELAVGAPHDLIPRTTNRTLSLEGGVMPESGELQGVSAQVSVPATTPNTPHHRGTNVHGAKTADSGSTLAFLVGNAVCFNSSSEFLD